MFRRFRQRRLLAEGGRKEVSQSQPRESRQSSTLFPSEEDPDARARRGSEVIVEPSSTAARYKLAERPKEIDEDPLGLQVLHEPSDPPKADIIFVHGLGGSSRRSWSKNGDPNMFWPQEWLPLEPYVNKARIWSFGYNSRFLSSKAKNNILNITDFARDLLFGIRFSLESGDPAVKVGQFPVIFVAHSMGGIVVKKAVILAHSDAQYSDITQALQAILFLSTPHRGSQYAEMLNHILSVSVRRYSPKQYISELKTNSPALVDINDQFRNLASGLKLFSFYETLATNVGPATIMILNKDTSTLGWPGEHSKAMDADHHDVCKFSSADDGGYVDIKNILQGLVRQSLEGGRRDDLVAEGIQRTQQLQQLEDFFSLPCNPADDLEFFLLQRSEGSCEWTLSDPVIERWMSDVNYEPSIVWCTGRPGAGKSVFTSYIIDYLKLQGRQYAYFFFRHDDPAKGSLSMFLKSLALQIADFLPTFRQRLLRLLENGFSMHSSSGRVIWQRVFTNILFKCEYHRPLFLIVDGVDECEQPTSIVRLLTDLRMSTSPLRLIFISRPTQTLSSAFARIRETVKLDTLPLDKDDADLQRYVYEEIKSLPGDQYFKERMKARILNKAEGNFLWVGLVLEEILLCHTQKAVEEAIDELPPDLELLYQRMDSSLAKTLRPSDLAMARTIFTWVTCARRTLKLDELSLALQPEYSHVLDLEVTIKRLCGDFVIVNNAGIRTMHLTAREYLTTNSDLEFYVSPVKAHHVIFKKCISALRVASLRSHVDRVLMNPFLRYAATSWPYHLKRSFSEESLLLLSEFFQDGSALTWIYILGVTRELQIMIQASKILRDFLKESDKQDAEKNPLMHRLSEKDILSAWTVDLIKIVGKFSAHLVKHPKTIFNIIPALCPPKSIIFQQVIPKLRSSVPNVTGLSNDDWDDCLAHFSITESQPMKIACINNYFAVLTMEGSIILYHAETFEEVNTLAHEEHVLAMCFNHDGDKIVTCSLTKTILWSIFSAEIIHSVKNPQDIQPMAVSFMEDSDDKIIVCFNNCSFRCMSFQDSENHWMPHLDVLRQDSVEFQRQNSPSIASFSPDFTQVAIGYRGLPLSVWALDETRPLLVGRCERVGDRRKVRQGILGGYTDVQNLCWNPITGHILGIFNDGCVCKWDPAEGSCQISRNLAVHIACSPDGEVFVTGSSNGTLKIWDFQNFAVICQISSTTPITDLAISQGTRRVHDLRNKFCSVWEPNALARLRDEDENTTDRLSSQESSTLVSYTSESSAEIQEPISAIAVDGVSHYYCTGDQNGVLKLFSRDGRQLSKTAPSYLGIKHLAWSEDGTFLASADLGPKIKVCSFDPGEVTSPLRHLYEMKEEGPICQLLWSPTNDMILASTKKGTSIWHVKSRRRVFYEEGPSYIWFKHPFEPGAVIGFTHDHVRISRWKRMAVSIKKTFDLYPTSQESEELSLENEPKDSPFSIKVLMPPDDATHAVIEISAHKSRKGKGQRRFFLLSLAELFDYKQQPARKSAIGALKAQPIPLKGDLFPNFELPLGLLPSDVSRKPHALQSLVIQDKPRDGKVDAGDLYFSSGSGGNTTLAFVDQEFWICSWTWSGRDVSSGSARRHFFLPRDWLDMECLELAILRNDGALLCPKNGEVAVISNGFDNEWIDY